LLSAPSRQLPPRQPKPPDRFAGASNNNEQFQEEEFDLQIVHPQPPIAPQIHPRPPPPFRIQISTVVPPSPLKQAVDHAPVHVDHASVDESVIPAGSPAASAQNYKQEEEKGCFKSIEKTTAIAAVASMAAMAVSSWFDGTSPNSMSSLFCIRRSWARQVRMSWRLKNSDATNLAKVCVHSTVFLYRKNTTKPHTLVLPKYLANSLFLFQQMS
jgi:hypothetical protein